MKLYWHCTKNCTVTAYSHNSVWLHHFTLAQGTTSNMNAEICHFIYSDIYIPLFYISAMKYHVQWMQKFVVSSSVFPKVRYLHRIIAYLCLFNFTKHTLLDWLTSDSSDLSNAANKHLLISYLFGLFSDNPLLRTYSSELKY